MTNRRKRQTSKFTPSTDDEGVWSAYAKSVKPLREKTRVGRISEDPPAELRSPKSRRMRGETGITDSRETSSNEVTSNQAAYAQTAREQQRVSHSAQTRGNAHRRQTTTMMDARVAKRLARGRTKVGARLDLHGLRQDEAYVTLKHFLISAQTRDLRTVLVITGKGDHDMTYEPWHHSIDGQRGILRRAVPNWLRQPEFTNIVVGFGPAHVRDGGEGAYYVQLRRRNKK